MKFRVFGAAEGKEGGGKWADTGADGSAGCLVMLNGCSLVRFLS